MRADSSAATWAASVPSAVRQDVGALLEVAAEVAGDLVRSGPSQPFAVLMGHDGTITLQAPFPVPDDVWETVAALADTVQSQAAGLRAALLVAACGDEATPFARVFGDHREGRPFAAWLEYAFVPDRPARAASVEVEPMQSGLF